MDTAAQTFAGAASRLQLNEYNELMNIARLVESSFHEAVKALTMGTSRSSLVRARERAYVKALIAHLQREFDGDDHRVFASSQRGAAADFGANRLLHDVTVCRIGAGETAARKPEDFVYIAEALWQIEVDFSRAWRPALYALNRLNCGAAADKLLIASSLDRGAERFLNSLRGPGSACQGRLHLALVPHPADWDDATGAPQTWQLQESLWVEMS